MVSSIQELSQMTLPSLTRQMTARTFNGGKPKMERWRRIEPEVREELVKSDIELIPRNLPEILAKIHTGETADGKGIFLIGTTGTGKTRRIEWASENFEIPMADAITLSLQLAEVRRDSDRMEVLNLVPPRFSEMPRHVCDLIIDDLGTEEETYNVYGTQRHLMTEAIIARYKYFPRWKTHFTSNLTKDQIRARYGERIWSRLNEMVVFVNLTGKDRRLGKR